jgi:G:T-mismatch repair DNA endonuclease (very short patch repair protein)
VARHGLECRGNSLDLLLLRLLNGKPERNLEGTDVFIFACFCFWGRKQGSGFSITVTDGLKLIA